MKDAASTTVTLDRVSMIMGTGMMIAWTLGIGIAGFVLLLAIAYALVFQNHTIAIICSFLLFAPLMITLLWGVIQATESIRERSAMSHPVSGMSWWEGRKASRMVY